LTKGGITPLYLPSGNSNLQFHVLAAGFEPPNLPFPCGSEGPHLIQCVTGPHQCTCLTAPKSIERFKQVRQMWQTNDRQTDRPRYEERCRNDPKHSQQQRLLINVELTKHFVIIMSQWQTFNVS